jgi:hypothetical protein
MILNPDAAQVSQKRAGEKLLHALSKINPAQPYLPHRCTTCGRYGDRDITELRRYFLDADRRGVVPGYPTCRRKRKWHAIGLSSLVLWFFFIPPVVATICSTAEELAKESLPSKITMVSLPTGAVVAFVLLLRRLWPPSLSRYEDMLAHCNDDDTVKRWCSNWQRVAQLILPLMQAYGRGNLVQRMAAWPKLIHCQRKYDP